MSLSLSLSLSVALWLHWISKPSTVYIVQHNLGLAAALGWGKEESRKCVSTVFKRRRNKTKMLSSEIQFLKIIIIIILMTRMLFDEGTQSICQFWRWWHCGADVQILITPSSVNRSKSYLSSKGLWSRGSKGGLDTILAFKMDLQSCHPMCSTVWEGNAFKVNVASFKHLKHYFHDL